MKIKRWSVLLDRGLQKAMLQDDGLAYSVGMQNTLQLPSEIMKLATRIGSSSRATIYAPPQWMVDNDCKKYFSFFGCWNEGNTLREKLDHTHRVTFVVGTSADPNFLKVSMECWESGKSKEPIYALHAVIEVATGAMAVIAHSHGNK